MVTMSGRGSTRVVRFQKVEQSAAKRRKAPLTRASPRLRRDQSLDYEDSARESDDESINSGSSRSTDDEDEGEDEEEHDLESSDSARSDSEEDEADDSSDEEYAGRKRPRTAAQRAALSSSSTRRPGSTRLAGGGAGASKGQGQGKGGSTADARAARLALRHAKSPSLVDRRTDVIVLEDGQGSGAVGGGKDEEEDEAAQQRSSRKAAQPVKGAASQVRSSEPASAVDGPLPCEWLGAPTRVELGVRTHYAAFRLRQVVFAAGDWVEVLAERPDATGKVHRRLYAARLLDAWCYTGQEDALHAEALVQWAYHADECGGAGGMTAQESAGPREVYPTLLCESVPLASINARAVLLPPPAWQDRRQRKAQERLVKGAKARVAQSAALQGAAKKGGALSHAGDCDSESEDSDCSAESSLRVQRLPAGEERVVAVYSARYSYDKPTRRFLPYTADPAADRARSHAILAAMGISPALGLVPPPPPTGAAHGARKGAGAGADKKSLPPVVAPAATPAQPAVVPASLLAHVRVPMAGEGVASGAGVLVGAGSTELSILQGGVGVGQAVGQGAGATLTTAAPPRVHGSSPSELYTATVRSLHLSSVPPTLPCRDAERAQIRTLLTAGIKQAWSGGGGTALYVSGMPGTGKTASVTEVVRTCTSQAAVGALPAFRYMEVNAMKLATPYALYSAVYRALTGVQVPPARACALLEARLTGKSGEASGGASLLGEGVKRGVGRPRKASKVEIVTPPPPAGPPAGSPGASASAPEGGAAARPHEVLVLVVDELDYLVTRKQSVLYNLFEWPMRAGSGLIVIGIANTMDMPERLLPRVASRLGLGRVVFTPYTPDQIQTIVQARLAALPPGVLDSMACTLASKKVASVSGDIRRALAMLSHAAKYALDRCTHAQATTLPAAPFTITLEDVKKASSSLAIDAHSARLAATTAHERLLLLSLAAHVQANGGEGAMLDTLHTRMQGILQAHVADRDVAAAMRVAPSCATLDSVRSALPAHTGSALMPPSTLAWAARWEEVRGLHEGTGAAAAAGAGAEGAAPAAAAVPGTPSVAVAAASPGSSEATALQLAARYLPAPPVSALATAARHLAESHILDVQALTVTGAASALAAGTVTGRITEGARLAGVYLAVRLCVGVDEVVAGLRGDPLLARLQAAGALL